MNDTPQKGISGPPPEINPPTPHKRVLRAHTNYGEEHISPRGPPNFGPFKKHPSPQRL